MKTSNVRTKYTCTLDKKKKKINRYVVAFLGSNQLWLYGYIVLQFFSSLFNFSDI